MTDTVTRSHQTLFETSTALFSPCGLYRYVLRRRWDDGPVCNFVMLNPSTADEAKNDPTVARCLNRARAWGFGSLVVTNLFAIRSTDPRILRQHADPVGPINDVVIESEAAAAGLVIAAWGHHGMFGNRVGNVLKLMDEKRIHLHALKVSELTGQPCHPLYLPYDLTPQRWWPKDPTAWEIAP